MNLFDPSICANRWFKTTIKTVSQVEYVLDDEPTIEVFETSSQRQQPIPKHLPCQKYRSAKMKCDELCSLMSELPEQAFKMKLNELNELLKSVKRLANQSEGFYFKHISAE